MGGSEVLVLIKVHFLTIEVMLFKINIVFLTFVVDFYGLGSLIMARTLSRQLFQDFRGF